MNRDSPVDSAYRALGRFVVRFRWFVVLFWIAVAVGTAALPSLGSQVNDNNSAFLSASEPSAKAANLAAPLIGSGAAGRVSQITIVGYRTGSLSLGDVTAVARELKLVQHVRNVLSARVLGVAAGGQAVSITVRVLLSANDITKDKRLVDTLERTFVTAKPPAGLRFALAGQVATLVANQASSNKAGNEVQAFSFLFIIVLLLLVFRSLPAAIVTLVPSGLALTIAGRVIGELGSGGLQVSAITQILLIVLLLGAGTDYGLFLVFRVREELRDGQDPHAAVERALVRVGESITASAGR